MRTGLRVIIRIPSIFCSRRGVFEEACVLLVME